MRVSRKLRIDPRLVIGLVLVAASVFGVVTVVRSMAETTTVYVAAAPLAKGDRVTESQLKALEVSRATPTSLYLTQATEADYIATRPVGAGELIPLTALGKPDSSEAAVVVTIPGELPTTVTTGTEVAVWAAESAERPGSYEMPQIIIPTAQVVRVIESGDFVARAEHSVELRIPEGDVGTLMAATANGARLQLVPLHEPVKQ